MIDTFHSIQRKILTDLLFGNRLKYSQLKPDEMEGSQFTFHLSKLIDAGLITKETEFYTLTAKGKNTANTFDSDSLNPTKQAKHSAVFCATRFVEEKMQVLVYTRKKQPFFDHQGFPTGKVMYGEAIIATAERELYEESGLLGCAELIGIRHFRVYFPTENELVEDKVMYVCRIANPTGELKGNSEGIFKWIDVDSISNNITNPLPEFSEILEMLIQFAGAITFAERNHYPIQF